MRDGRDPRAHKAWPGRHAMSLKQHYLHDAQQRGFQLDLSQEKAIAALADRYERLTASPPVPRSLLDRLRGRTYSPVRGLYLWGGVGRGKTYLVDRFMEALPFPSKQRLHFQSLMQFVHRRLRELPKTPDPLPIIASEMARGYRVLSFDEFHVDDIADAMLMAGLLRALFDLGLTMLFTSNQHPDHLYPNGLQRELFVPAIELVKRHCDVLHLDSGMDYRGRAGEHYPYFFLGADDAAEQFLREHFTARQDGMIGAELSLCINQRSLSLVARGRNTAWFDFSMLCATPRNASDYLAIADLFDTLLLSGVPLLTAESEDVAARFIALIDALYDRRVRLIMAAPHPLAGLYTGDAQQFAFQRTLSRLREMLGPKWEAKAC